MAPADTPLALTLGDPAGIGPDITLLAFAARSREPIPPFVLLGDRSVLTARAEALGLSVDIATVASAGEAADVFAEVLPVLPVEVPGPVVAGHPDVAAAPAVKRSIEYAVELVRQGEARAVVTNPIAKSLLYQAGFPFPGHTEYLAALAAGRRRSSAAGDDAGGRPVQSGASDDPHSAEGRAGAAHHGSAPGDHRATDTDLRRYFGFLRPRLAVSGFNPHAGEDGSLGREEIDIIAPAIEAAKAEGIDVTGPYPADTMFHTAARETYDAALCMYHDQALVPFKTLAFDEGVNVTLGLPFVRTSPDHGTAFDIAGTGKANPKSLIEALRLADAMSRSTED